MQNICGNEYGFKEQDTIKATQLLSLILYCDTNDLQSNFSATFRKKHQYESINQLKKRHRKYFHFAKGLVEAIMFFGVTGYSAHRDADRTDFFLLIP